MTSQSSDDSTREEYQGSLTIPSETEPRNVSLFLDSGRQEVSIRFDEPVAGSSDWTGSSVRVVRRLKYVEIQFMTTGIPQDPVELVWKLNAGLDDDTAAGVVIARPNELRISGEKGFILQRSG